jgi:formate C-acetyltransferase
MTGYIQNQLDFFVNKREHRKLRREIPLDLTDIAGDERISADNRATLAHARILRHEEILVFPNEKIAGTRVMLRLPEYPHPLAKHLGRRISHMLNEPSIGGISNNVAYYEKAITIGLEGLRKEVEEQLALKTDKESRGFLENQLYLIDEIEQFAERFRDEAKRVGNETVYQSFCQIPASGARNFLEALQFVRFLNFTLRYENPTHTPFGRFDQYMYPFFKADRDAGMSYEEALELVSDFFICLNRDSDIYFGIQQGDNGQAMVLGGVDAKGNNAYTELSEICIKASLELGVIDPKINLRVNKDTPIEVFELGTQLTKKGLGFPQYSNDDVVVPALVNFGYDLEDARDYAVAGCWEFIIPNYGAEGINYEAMPFVKLVNTAMDRYLPKCGGFEEFLGCVEKCMEQEMREIDAAFHYTPVRSSPMNSLLSKQAIQKGRDISKCGKYNNYGIHGPGIATAVDSLAVIKKYVFDEKSIKAEDLIDAVKNNFENNKDLLHILRFEAPKMGNGDDYVDDIAVKLVDMYARVLSHYKNGYGGIYRPGTGSAMYYIWMAQDIGASADGRLRGEPLPANYSPSLNVKLDGPISMFKSFCKPDLKKVCNGGPLTLELHDSVFRNNEAIGKVASLVQTFVESGGHQLQLNAVNADVMRNAQAQPEKYRNLVVRVWGWSGYFVELSKEYQDHIISRAALSV